MTIPPTPSIPTPPRVRLAGTVADVPACECVSDRDRIVVGSSRRSDLWLADPLVPRRAFTLRRDAANSWIIEAARGARVYVNDRLSRRERLTFADTISVGCHRLVFEPASGSPRNFRSTTTVDDLYPRLLAGLAMPVGFLHGTPQWQARRRLRSATSCAVSLLLAIVVLFWLTPRPIVFEQVQPPIEVVMVAEQALSPDPTAVRSLNDVARRSVDVPPEAAPPELAAREPAPAIPAEAPVTETMPELATLDAPAPVRRTVVAAAGSLAPLTVADTGGARLAVTRPARAIERTAPARRLSIQEVTDPVFAREIATHQIQVNPEAWQAVAAIKMTGRATEPTRPRVTNVVIRTDPAKLAALLQYEPSPLVFTKVSGHQVPVARLPGKLGALEIKGTDQAITLDGTVSEAEIAMSWKSGQFRADAPGNPPPFGQPPTYCYVGKADLAGKPHLYISFVCIDPNVNGILNSYDNVWRAATTITSDDSIEIFLDTNFDRTDYHQLIVNTRGYYWGQYCRSYRDDGAGLHWDPKPQIKTAVSREAGRWTCEVMIPFDQLGGVPAKGAQWSVNFYRNYRGQKAADHQLQNWFLVYDPGTFGHYYHNPRMFGVFQW